MQKVMQSFGSGIVAANRKAFLEHGNLLGVGEPPAGPPGRHSHIGAPPDPPRPAGHRCSLMVVSLNAHLPGRLVRGG